MKNNETFDFGSDEELDFGSSSNSNNDDFLSSEESNYNYNDINTSEKSTEVSSKSKTKKTALICIVVALAIIAVLSIIYRAKSGDSSNKDNVQNTSYTEKSGTAETGDGWTQFSGGVSVEFSNYVTSSIIVTSIKNKAMITSEKGDRIIKTVVSGSVSGLTGTYELEMPFTKAVDIKLGEEYPVKYRIAEYNGYRLITDLTYSE